MKLMAVQVCPKVAGNTVPKTRSSIGLTKAPPLIGAYKDSPSKIARQVGQVPRQVEKTGDRAHAPTTEVSIT